MSQAISTIFLDIGGVLGTNGWDYILREQAAEKFSLNFSEMEERHHLTFDTYEEGKLSLDEYLQRVVFYEKRFFSKDVFKKFMFAGSKPYLDAILFFRNLKSHFSLKVVAVSNEGRELNDYRLKRFELHSIIDFFVLSSAVHFRKPDLDIFRLALAATQVDASEIVYVDDRAMFVEVASSLGIQGIHHISLKNTKDKFAAMGFSL